MNQQMNKSIQRSNVANISMSCYDSDISVDTVQVLWQNFALCQHSQNHKILQTGCPLLVSSGMFEVLKF